ncbi:MAG: tetratricopeptide repeat protein [Deltaproteobacteria bacterium]|nr:tetratricopeptide repeat protein [Deltaproteobacteria bacterium]
MTDPRPLSERRQEAHRNLLQGNTEVGKAQLRHLWREEPGPSRAEDAVLLMAALAREGALEEGLALLAEGQQAALGTASMADLAAALAANLPQPGLAVIQIQGKVTATRSAAHAALLARLHERARDVRQAIPLWELAARMAPRESTYQRELMRLHAVTANGRGLETALRNLVELEPRDLSARVNLVRTLARNGRREEALRKARLPEEFLSGTEAEISAGEVLVRAGLGPEARAVFEAVLEEDPDHCEARYGRARALLVADQAEAGEKALLALVKEKVGGQPCRVVEAVRDLAIRESWRGHYPRLKRLAKQGKGADPEALRGVMQSLGPEPLPGRSARHPAAHRRVGPSHYAIDGPALPHRPPGPDE